MSTAKYQITNFTVDDPATLKAKLDGNSAVLARTGGAYQCHAADAPDMTVKVAAGGQLVAGALVENALQTSGAIVAPVANPRIDRVVIDQSTGVASIVAGAEAAIPAAPAIPEGKWPCARFQLATATVAITNNMIVDERPFVQKPSASTAYGAVWQSIRSAALDSSGYNAMLSAGAGLNFNVDASPTAAILDFGNGSTISTATLSADAANQGALVASNTNFLYADYVSATSVTWGNCLIPPQYGYAFDRTQGALLNFEAADASTTMLDGFGNTWTAAGNAQIDTAQFKFGTSSLLLDGTDDWVDSTSINTLGDGGWTVEAWIRFNSTAAQQTIINFGQGAASFGVTLEMDAANVYGYLSSDGASWLNTGPTFGGANASVVNTWYHVALTFDSLAGVYRIYVDGVQKASYTSTARICGLGRARIGARIDNTSDFNGWIDGFRFVRACLYPGGTNFTPPAAAPAITDHKIHFLSIPARTMYEVTAASSAAGSNPTLTARTRLFVGEQDTNATVVTATRNYAIRGEYYGTAAVGAIGTRTSVNHNIGVVPLVNRIGYKCITTDGSGYAVGDVVWGVGNEWYSGSGFSVSSTDGADCTRLSIGHTRGANTTSFPVKTTGAGSSLVAANWNYIFFANRGW